MTGVIEHRGARIEYEVRTSRRARRVNLTVREGGDVVVTLPLGVPFRVAERFVASHAQWLTRKLEVMRARTAHTPIIRHSRVDYKVFRARALQAVTEIADRLCDVLGVRYRSISIRNQKTRWGSCSRRGDLSFNYRLIFLPPPVQDYLVAHELCHLREFNHSQAFWCLVAGVVPTYHEHRTALRAHRLR